MFVIVSGRDESHYTTEFSSTGSVLVTATRARCQPQPALASGYPVSLIIVVTFKYPPYLIHKSGLMLYSTSIQSTSSIN